MAGVGLILRVVALVLFILAAAGAPTKINLVPAGLACWLAAELL